MAVEYKLIPKRNPQDPEAEPKYYATPVYHKTITMEELAREVSARSTTTSEGDVYSVLVDVRDIIRAHIADSDRVHIAGIGTFEIGLSSGGADTKEAFHPSDIKGGHVKYRPDTPMREFVDTVKFARYVAKDEPPKRADETEPTA